jgi:hypothetical protein
MSNKARLIGECYWCEKVRSVRFYGFTKTYLCRKCKVNYGRIMTQEWQSVEVCNG